MKSYRVYLDGNSWCAVDGNFVDLQQSLAGFGDTPLIALGELLLLEIAQYVADVGQAAQAAPADDASCKGILDDYAYPIQQPT